MTTVLYEFGSHLVKKKDGTTYVAYGLAVNLRDALPGASFIGFTGTPIEKADANTRAVFGNYVSVYDIERAVKDGATVPIYYESRLAKLKLDEAKKPQVDAEFEEATEGEETEHKEKLKTKWAALEALVGADERSKLVAALRDRPTACAAFSCVMPNSSTRRLAAFTNVSVVLA